MRAMILAAGLGTRLHPLTNDRPKALVEVAGQTLLAITLRRLRAFGIRDVIVNVHHFADLVIEYLKKNDYFGMHIETSREDELLDTGGGLKKAAWFFLENSGDADQPFLLHNVDVLSAIDFDHMLRAHNEHRALATLAVQDRETSRYLLFDEKNEVCGRRAGRDGDPQLARPAARTQALAFSGVHVISSRFLSLMAEQGAFSIIDSYLRLASQRERILAFRADEYYWRDLGKPENIAQAEQDVKRQILRV
jgi:mannose-1-phosphate guanylyltransferase